jgi:DNA-binding GntR family transcriptional regulator
LAAQVPAGHVDTLTLPSFGDRLNLREQVAHALRAALITGEMRPGVLYSAPTLAEQLGVSATPVREAMLDLAKEGLVQAVRNKGFRVTELTGTELDDILEIRTLIEVPTVARIARDCDEALAPKVEALREIARQIVDKAVEPDLIGYIEADRRFHVELLRLAGNEHLVSVVRDLRARARLYGLQQLAQRGVLEASAREHEQLLDLVLARDAEGAAALMKQHMLHVRSDWAGEAGKP